LGADSQTINFKNFCFKHYTLSQTSFLKQRIVASRDIVLMQFCIQGECILLNKKDSLLRSFKAFEHNVIWFPAGEVYFTSDCKTLEIVNLYFEKDYLLKYIPDDHSLKAKFDSTSISLLFKNNLYLQPKIQNVLHDMIYCQFTGHLKKLYIQAKAIELFSLQLVQYEEEKKEINVLKQGEIDKILKVKELIKNNIGEHLSLAFLAREAGTNEQYLKKHFKMVFGDTVFGYILSCRMEKAREMLSSGDHKISFIAEIAGYKHATHFTTAFKKFHGYLPQQLKGKAVIIKR
jgi:AraC-like DNA-binding protein